MYTICCTMRVDNLYHGGIHKNTGINMRIPSFGIGFGLQRVEGGYKIIEGICRNSGRL